MLFVQVSIFLSYPLVRLIWSHINLELTIASYIYIVAITWINSTDAGSRQNVNNSQHSCWNCEARLRHVWRHSSVCSSEYTTDTRSQFIRSRIRNEELVTEIKLFPDNFWRHDISNPFVRSFISLIATTKRVRCYRCLQTLPWPV